MGKVYAVVMRSIVDDEVVGVYSTLELAQKAHDYHSRPYQHPVTPHITECELDAERDVMAPDEEQACIKAFAMKKGFEAEAVTNV